MVPLTDIVAWMALGLAASLAGMILPFQRGLVGVLVNIASSVLGALAGGLFSYVLLPSSRAGDSPARLFFAVVGGLGAIVVVHFAYFRRVARGQRRARTAQRRPAA